MTTMTTMMMMMAMMMMMTYVNASIEAGSVVSFDNLSSIDLSKLVKR